MDWMELAQDTDRWWALVNAVMNLQVFLISNFRRVLNLVYVLLGISPASDCFGMSAKHNLTLGKYPKEHTQPSGSIKCGEFLD
jgi:hypothetical protein